MQVNNQYYLHTNVSFSAKKCPPNAEGYRIHQWVLITNSFCKLVIVIGYAKLVKGRIKCYYIYWLCAFENEIPIPQISKAL